MVMKRIFLMGMFLFFSLSILSAQEIVSDIYEVDSYNLGVSGNEDSNNETNSILLVESGAIFVQNDYGGESYRYPEDILIVETPVGVGGNGGSGAGGNGGSGGEDFLNCSSNLDCEQGLSCLNGKCVKLFNLKILNFKSPVNKNESFEFEYEIEILLNPLEKIFIEGQMMDENSISINYDLENISLDGFVKEERIKKLSIPPVLDSGEYIFNLNVNYSGAHLTDSKKIFLIVKDDKIKIKKYRNWDLIIGLSVLSIFILVGLIYLICYYRKSRQDIIFNLVSFFSAFYVRIKRKWRQFILWIKKIF